jgi:four helix bundle protein
MPAGSGAPLKSGRDYSFKTLLSWQKAQVLLLEVMQMLKTIPNDREFAVFAQQIVRSSSAIGANIAEGHGRYSAGAYRNHLSIARGSTAETISWLDVLRRAGYISDEIEARLVALCEEIMSLVSAKMIQLDKATRTDRSIRDEREEYIVD